MKSAKLLNHDNFMNRVALDDMVDPTTLDPIEILRQFFDFARFQRIQELFTDFCDAAMSDDYSWKGSPGNLLFFSEKLEQLLEACYLIHSRNSKAIIAQSLSQQNDAKQVEPTFSLPKYNSFDLPTVLDVFFVFQSFPEWKFSLHAWTEAAMSRYSVTDSVDLNQILPFTRQLHALILSCHFMIHNLSTAEKR